MTGDRSVKPWFAAFGGLIGISIGLAAIAWVLDSILDSIIFHEGTILGQLLSPTVDEIGVRVLFGFVIIVFGTYTQLNMDRRKRLEEVLWQSEEKYRMLVENVQEGVFIIQDAKLRYVNEAFARTAGYQAGEIIDRDFKDLVAPEDLEMVADRYHRRQAGENVPDEYEFHVMRKDGTRIIANMNVGLVTYHGRVASMGILKDITERKVAQEALRKSEEKFRGIFEQSPIAIELYDKMGKLIDANRSCLDLFGVNNIESVIGFKLFDDPNIPEDTKTRLSNGESIEFESVFDFELVKKARLYETTKSGKCYLDILIVPLTTEERKIYGYLVHVRDITERKQAEDALRKSEKAMKEAAAKAEEERNKSNAIIAALSDGIIIQDTDYKIIYQNQVQNDLFGDRIGEYCYKAYEGRDTICEWCPVEITFRDGKIHRTEREMNTESGTMYYELISSPLRDSTGKIIAGVKVVRDITERKRAEEKLREGEHFLASIFESIQDGIGIIDKDMNILRINKTTERWYPHTTQFIGRKCYEIYHGRSERCETCPAWRTLKTGESAHDVVPRHGPGGKEAGWAEIYSFPLFDTTTGQMKGVIEYVRDITERKKVEEKIRLLSEAVDEAPDGVIITDLNGFIIYSNRAVEDFYGFSRDELKEKHVSELNTDPEFTRSVILPDLRTKGRWVGELKAKKKMGMEFPIWLTTSIVKDSNGEPIAMVGVIRDITERKQAEAAIRESEERLHQAVRVSQIGIFDHDHRTDTIYWSPEQRHIYGFGPEEPVTLPAYLKHVYPDDRERIAEAVRRAHDPSGDGSFDVEHRIVDRNGSIHWLSTRSRTHFEGEGSSRHPVRTVGGVVDITERKRIEKVLLESEERYRSLFEDSPISLWEEDSSDLKKYIDTLKSKGIINLRAYFDKYPEEVALCAGLIKIVDVNKATINLFKAKSKEDIIGGLEKIFTERSFETFKDNLIAMSEGKTSFESEDIAKTLTGDKIHISVRWVLTPGNEETYSKRLVSMVDITERKRAEEELNLRAQLAMLGAEVGIALTQGDTLPRILQRCTEALVKYLDAALARIWTLNQAENILELQASAGIYTHIDGFHSRIPLGSFKIGHIAKERKPHLTNSVIGDPRIHDQEWAKQEGMVAFAGYPLIVEDRLVGVVAMFARQPLSDFALKALASVADSIALGIEHKQVEEAMKRYAMELEESNHMKELFTDIMHHDLLNPLTTANGFIELLKENETISRKKAYLETIERSLVKGMELIDSAMKFSRFESLKSIELEELDLKKIIEDVIEALTPFADNAGMEIANRITSDLPVRANKIIEEVFSNLISNAIKYASSGKRIIIESENQGKNLQVRIIDFGEGIKESDKTMIFERFRRGGKTGVKGSGLGLAIAGKIMELHKGRIWVEDNPEGGSIFIVEIQGI